MSALKSFGYFLLLIVFAVLYLACGILMAGGIVWALGLHGHAPSPIADMLWLIMLLGPGVILWGIISLLPSGPKT